VTGYRARTAHSADTLRHSRPPCDKANFQIADHLDAIGKAASTVIVQGDQTEHNDA